MDIRYDWSRLDAPSSMGFFEPRWATKGESLDSMLDFSGVWRFRELMPFYRDVRQIVTIGEGRTNLQDARLLAPKVGLTPGKLFLQYEGLNPSGSFKDNGMAAAFRTTVLMRSNSRISRHTSCEVETEMPGSPWRIQS
ncbi:MAG: hypothetical protein QF735_12745, partial [Phycisphaeraceae bacterium]|nr:hypothetical protein [Phycisphaeraceae bacterium]